MSGGDGIGEHPTQGLLDLFTLGGAKVISKPTVIDGCLYLPYYSKDWIEGRYRMAFMHKDIVELNPYSDKDWALSLNGLPDTNLLFNGHLHKNAEIVNGARKLIQIVFGLSIAFAASSFFLSFFSFGGGALV